MMALEETWEEVKDTYQALLQQLTYNSKRRIHVLTILAEDYACFAKGIVSLIEAQINKAPPSRKLPAMYLMDSILKKVGGDYIPEFAEHLTVLVPCVFKQVDAKTKKCLFELRSTWNGLFPVTKLLVLDIRIQVLDPAWPITSLPPNLDFSSSLAKLKLQKKSEHEHTTPARERKAIATENSENHSLRPSAKQSPCVQHSDSRKRRCGSLSPTASPPKVKKVSSLSAPRGPEDQP